MSLHDDLVRMLHEAASISPYRPPLDFLDAVADECIRQMKWTHLSAKWANPEGEGMWELEVREDGEPNITAAPEGWKP